MTTTPRRLITAQDYDTAPPHTVVEFDRRPGALGYLNWDHRWEVSDDHRDYDYAGIAIAEHDGPSTVIRWGDDSTTGRMYPQPKFPAAAPLGDGPEVALLLDDSRYTMLTPEQAMNLAQDLVTAARTADTQR